MQKNNYIQYLEFANALADASGEILRYGFKTGYKVEQKADLSPVTQLDIAVEERIRALIEEKFPEHGIVGEELGNIREESPYQWVIDPIDGTKAFIAGKTTFTTLIALLHHEKPMLGIIDQPIQKERWAGVSSERSFYNTTPLPRLNNQKSLQTANISTTSTDYFTEEQAAKFAKLCEKAENCILGGDAYAYGLLASGNLDAVVDAGMKPYDFCALAPVIEGVGGIITDWAGKPLSLHSDGSVIACANKGLYGEALNLTKL